MANLRLNLNLSSCFFRSKEIFLSMLSRHFRKSKNQIVGKRVNWNLHLESSDLNSNLALTLGNL